MTHREVDRLAPQRFIRGHYSFTQPVPLHIRAQTIINVAGADAAVCGATALSLAKVDLPARLVRDTRVWVQVPKQQTWPRRPGVRLVRSTHIGPKRLRLGLPTLELPYCWLQLAAESNLDELVEVADAMTCRQRPVTTKASLVAAVESRKGSPGIRKACAALDLAREGTDSIPETDLRLLLVSMTSPGAVPLRIRGGASSPSPRRTWSQTPTGSSPPCERPCSSEDPCRTPSNVRLNTRNCVLPHTRSWETTKVVR